MTTLGEPDVEAIYELAPLQEGMLVDTLIADTADLYVEQIVLALPGPVSMAAMAMAWRRVVERHGALRTSFHWRDLERPLQVVHRRVDVPVSFIDLTTVPPERRDAAALRYLRRDRERGIDLERAPLLRVAVLQRGPTRHDLLVTVHHAVLDGWSTTIVMEEVSRVYRELEAGVPARLGETRPYLDYLAWIGRQDDGDAERYWRDLLGDYTGATPVGRLGTKAGLQVAGPAGADVSRTLPRELTGRLEQLARRLRITLNTVVLGAWSIVLGRHLGVDDLVIGAVVSGRDVPVPGVESIVGLLINTVPVRARLDADMAAGAWLRQLHSQQLRTRDHQHCSLTKVHGWSGVRRGDALFESIFVFENHVSPAGSRVAARAFERTGYPLTVLVGVAPDLSIRVLPDAAIVTGEVVSQLLDHLVHVLAATADDPDQPLGRLELMAPPERDAVLAMGCGRPTPVPGVGVHELFGRVAGGVPGGVALVVGGERVSFGELEGLAGRLASWLVSVGVGRGDVVGVCVPRGVWLVAAMLGVWKVGGVVLVLEPDVAVGRLGFMAEDAGVVAVVTTRGCRGVAPSCGVVVVVDGEWPGGLVPVVPVSVGAGDGAWVLYTSGSSGVPKGVLGSHGGLVNRLWWGWRVAPFGVGEVACAKTRAGFVDSVWEVFGPLLAGVTVVVVDEVTAGDPVGLAEVVVGEGVTRLVGVPSLLSVLFEVAGERLRGSRLVEVTASGEVVSGELVRRVRSVLPGCRVVNLYGSTEVAGDATGFVVPEGWVGERVPIGRPLDNVWVVVVGASGEVVPVGVVGELVVGGAAVALGYVGRAGRVDGAGAGGDAGGDAGEGGGAGVGGGRFVVDRWSGSGGRVYRTGDLGRWRADGVLEFVGRADRQVKVRGVRVEPGEVEVVLVGHPEVAEAAVVARPGPGGGVELVGFVVWAGVGVGVDALRGWLRARLVEQMVPARLVAVEALPRLANGKLDRAALVGRGEVGGSSREYEAPVGVEEEAVAAVFAELTGVARVGRHDDFFADLGGHSLLATRAVSRLRGPFGRDVALRLLFEHPTVADLTHTLTALTPTPTPLDTITPLDRHHYRTS